MTHTPTTQQVVRAVVDLALTLARHSRGQEERDRHRGAINWAFGELEKTPVGSTKQQNNKED